MATSDFLPFATAANANVLTQSAYAALSAILNGFTSGVAPSAAVNKAIRQSSIMSAVLAQFIADQTSANSVDDGTTATLKANLLAAVKAVATALFTQNIAANGWVKLPNGVIVQWGGGSNDGSGDSTVAFASAFPNAALAVVANSQAIGSGVFVGVNTLTKTTFKAGVWASNSQRQVGSTFFYFAIGY